MTRAADSRAAGGVAGARVTLAMCAAAALLEGFDNQATGVAAPRLIAELGLGAEAAGIVLAATPLGLFLGAAAGGRIADHLGRKHTLVVSLMLFGLCSFLTALAPGVLTLFAARLLTGIGLGGALPNYIALSAEALPRARRVSVVTVVMAGMPLGGGIAGLVALGASLGWDWRVIFRVGGIAPVILALAMLAFMPESGAYRESTQGERRPRVQSIATALFSEARAPATLLLWASFFFTQLVLFLMLNWLPSLILGLGHSHSQASWASIWFNVLGALGSGFLGRLHVGRAQRLWIVLTYAGMAASLAGIGASGASFWLVGLACGLAGVFINGAQMILYATVPLYYPTAIRGTGVGATVAAGRTGSVAGPLFAGALLSAGTGGAGVLLALTPFIAIGGGTMLALSWRAQVAD